MRKLWVAVGVAVAAAGVVPLASSNASAAVVGGGWKPTAQVKQWFTWCGGTTEIRSGLYEQTCIAATDSHTGPQTGRYWQTFTVFTAKVGKHNIQVQSNQIEECSRSNSTQPCNPYKTYSLGGCPTMALAQGSSYTCVSGAADVLDFSGPPQYRLRGAIRLGADGALNWDNTPWTNYYG